jgi:surface antigen
MEQSTQQALATLPTGQAVQWRNPDTGHFGTVTPMRTTTRPDEQYCREFQQTITVSGRTEEAFGIACRQPDGTWRIVA